MTPGTCIHYTGMLPVNGPHVCGAGVDLDATFDDTTAGQWLRMPCIQFREVPAHGRGTYCKPGEPTKRVDIDRRGQVMIPCALREEPTAEQVQAAREQMDLSLKKAMTAIRLAAEWRVKPKPAQDRLEVVKCAVCSGRLHLSQSSLNGHVHGQCETAGCVSWME